MSSVLVTAIGSYAAEAVIQKLKQEGYRVVGCDINKREIIANSLIADAYYISPYVKYAKTYLEFIYEVCKKENISHIIPLIDPEVDFLSRYREEFEKEGITLCISDRRTIELCRNKLALAEYISKNTKVDIIQTYRFNPDITPDFPAVCKPSDGRSSEGLYYIYEEADWENFLRRAENKDKYIVQEYIQGDIICVDIIRNPEQEKTVSIARRELLRTAHGAGLSVHLFEDEKLCESCEILANILNIKGCVNFEFIQTPEGKYFFMECNPRFSGGVAFSCLAGYDCIKNHMRCFTNSFDKLKNEGIDSFKLAGEIYMARKYRECITG